MKLRSQMVVKADVANKNDRIYSKEVIEKVIKDFKELPPRAMMGCLGMQSTTVIPFKEVSHIITDLRIENDCLVADIEILDTPQGKTLQTIMEAGNLVAFRMAGIGSVENETVFNVIGKDYKLISIHAISAEEAS